MPPETVSCPWCGEELLDVRGSDSAGRLVRLHLNDTERPCPGPPAPERSAWGEDKGDVT